MTDQPDRARGLNGTPVGGMVSTMTIPRNIVKRPCASRASSGSNFMRIQGFFHFVLVLFQGKVVPRIRFNYFMLLRVSPPQRLCFKLSFPKCFWFPLNAKLHIFAVYWLWPFLAQVLKPKVVSPLSHQEPIVAQLKRLSAAWHPQRQRIPIVNLCPSSVALQSSGIFKRVNFAAFFRT